MHDAPCLFLSQMPDDAVMLRFLRARDCNLEKVMFEVVLFFTTQLKMYHLTNWMSSSIIWPKCMNRLMENLILQILHTQPFIFIE